MKSNIFDKLIEYINEKDSRIVILQYSEIVDICGPDFKNEITNPLFFQNYAELAEKLFVEAGLYWDNDPKYKFIVFKKINYKK